MQYRGGRGRGGLANDDQKGLHPTEAGKQGARSVLRQQVRAGDVQDPEAAVTVRTTRPATWRTPSAPVAIAGTVRE